jgi:uncharacterized protein
MVIFSRLSEQTLDFFSKGFNMKLQDFKWLAGLITSVFFATTALATTPKMITVTQKHNIRVVYDIDQNQMEAGVGQGLYYVRGLLESYKKQGIALKELHIVVVVHGSAVSWTLNNKTYEKYMANPFTPNPNEQIIKELIAHGVSVEACNVSLREHHWTAKNVMPGVAVTFDAYTRMIDLQMQGYAYIKLP